MTDETNPTPAPHSPQAPAERARIEATPPQKRVDALPVLYVVGFVILAASLIYLWKHPSLPRNAALEVARLDTMRQQTNAIQARVDALEARPAPAGAPNLGPLEARLAAVEARPAAPPAPVVDLAPLDRRIAAFEAKPPVDLAPIEARIAALDAKPPVDLGPLQSRIGALEAKPPVDLGPLEARIEAVGKSSTDAVAALAKRVDGLEAQTKRLDALEAQARQLTATLTATSDKAALAGRLQAASAALAAGQRLGDIPGAPAALARFAIDAPPTEAGLRLSFDKFADAAHRASQPAITDDQPLLSRMWTRAQQSVTVRQGERVLVGDPIAGVLAGARQSLDAGDLAGAVKALDSLAGPAKAAMADWVGQARALLDARAAIGDLAARR